MRDATRTGIRMALLSCLILLFPASAVLSWAASEISWDTPDKKWRSGPVKYILSKEESKEFKQLKTDEDREAFVEAFWAHRDPTPGTEVNEYRVAFYQRARDATERFSEDGGKGWQDDRGRVYIVMGPPDDIVQADSLLASDSTPTTTLPGSTGYGNTDTAPTPATRTVRFIYFDNPITGEGRLELSFRSDVTGGFRLQERIDWEEPVLRGLGTPVNSPAPRAASVPATPGPPSTAPQAPTPPTPPEPVVTPEAELMETIRSDQGVDASIPLQANLDYHKAADESTSVSFTLEVPRSALPAGVDLDSLVVSAEVVDASTGESVQQFFRDDLFGSLESGEGEDAVILLQSQRALEPGNYTVFFGLEEPETGAIGKLERAIEVPSYAGSDLQLSTITLARKLERVSSPPEEGEIEPFVHGNFRIVPRSHGELKHGDELIWYYQIYGAQKDPASGKPKVDLSYTIETKKGSKWLKATPEPIAFPGQEALVQAYGLRIEPQFPSGEWRVTIDVHDALSDRSTTAVLPFSISSGTKTSKAN